LNVWCYSDGCFAALGAGSAMREGASPAGMTPEQVARRAMPAASLDATLCPPNTAVTLARV
jgi:hypothetical protein